MSDVIKKIHVTATDNELYILAAHADGSGSFEICHLKSGYNEPVEYTTVPRSILPPGDYYLIMIGINWGGTQKFKVILTTADGRDIPYEDAPASTDIGANWTKSVPITVPDAV